MSENLAGRMSRCHGLSGALSILSLFGLLSDLFKKGLDNFLKQTKKVLPKNLLDFLIRSIPSEPFSCTCQKICADIVSDHFYFSSSFLAPVTDFFFAAQS